ncbi:hypothetical protein GQ457_02G028980 [Hibiscus cannabinus]
MATRQIRATIFLYVLFLSLVLLLILPVSNGAMYRIHGKMIGLKDQFSINLLTKGVPIPPSGPSKRHNLQPDGHGSGGGSASDKDGLRV